MQATAKLEPADVNRRLARREKRLAFESKIFQLELGAYMLLCEEINTPRSLACYILMKHKEYVQYLELGPAYHDDDFPLNHGVTEMMRKNPRLPITIDRRQVALDKFFESETTCRETNERFRGYPYNSPAGLSDYPQLVQDVRGIIAGILGTLSPSKLRYAESEFRFGPGATSDVSGKKVLLSNKITMRKYGITPRLARFRNGLLWPGATVRLHAYSKLTTVPKSALTDRTIAIEPHLNVYVQLGIGSLIRKRLEQNGLLCSTQEFNRQAALLARKCGWATVDLSAASDTISTEVVEALLPADWFELLYSARTDFVQLPDKQFLELEKFSSMGNGFTWELETLIFWAIARAVSRRVGVNEWDTLAFGDDIVIDAKAYPLLARALDHFGFKVNSKKSFWQGDFFESCGVDVFRNQDVRPCYFKGEYQDVETFAIRTANALRRYAHRLGHGYYCDRRVRRSWLYLVNASRRGRKTAIPDGYGDDGIVRNFDEVSVPRAPRGWQGWRCKVLRRMPLTSGGTDQHGACNAALAWGTPGTTRSVEFVRGVTSPPQLRSMIVFTWNDLGPWM